MLTISIPPTAEYGKQNTAKPVLEGVRIVALYISSHERLNKTESAVFLYCRFSIS